MIAYHDFSRPLKLFIVTFICAMCFSQTHAYDSPNFDFTFLDEDALLISQREKDNLTEALVSVASNFPDSNLIDEDIKEKAMALALIVNPLNPNAREAHDSLLRGKRPRKTAYYQQSVSEVSEALWSSADRITRSGEPEAERLALFLREISLIISPQAPRDRIKYFGKVTNEKPPSWKNIVTLQPNENKSNGKLKFLYQAIRTPSIRPPSRPSFFDKPSRPNRPKPTRPERPVNKPSDSLALNEVEIPFVAQVRGTIRTGYQAGTASLVVQKASPEDDFLFRDREGGRGKQMVLVPDNEGLRLFGFPRAEYLVRKEYTRWPQNVLGNILFQSEFPMRSSPRTTTANMSAAGTMLLYSAFSGKKPIPEMCFAGSILGSQSNPHFSLDSDNLMELLEGGKLLDRDFFLVPETAYDALLEGAIKTRQLEYLFDPQLISYKDWEQLKQTAYEPSEALKGASDVFKQIQAVQDKMPLVELARNQKVQERLNNIIKSYPQHLSAKVMLGFGNAPDDPEALIKESVRQVDEVMAPIYKVVGLAMNREFDPDEWGDLKEETEDVEFSLQKLDSTINPKIKDYLKQAREVAKQARKFLGVSNFRTSLGRQRVKEFRNSFELLNAARESLGMEEFDF